MTMPLVTPTALASSAVADIRALPAFAAAAQKHVKTRANAALGPLGAQNGLLRPARVPPVRSKGLFEPASAPLVRSRWPLWPAPEPPVRSERLIELAWAPPVRSKWPVWHAPVWSVCSKRLSEPASVPPVRSKRLFERAVRDRCSQKLVSVALCSEPLHSALLCSVHGYARVHTSILYMLLYWGIGAGVYIY